MAHSQGGEEDAIRRAVLGELGSIDEGGYVLDIGAFDGETLSNSRALLERGWKGLLVEPSPFAFQKLLALYEGAKDVNLINAAIGLEAAHLVPFNEGGLYGSTDPKARGRWESIQKFSRPYWVPTVTVEQIVNQFPGAPDVISIDTEGTSFEIFKRLPTVWSSSVSAVVVEHDRRMVEICQWALKNYNLQPCYLDDNNVVLRPA